MAMGTVEVGMREMARLAALDGLGAASAETDFILQELVDEVREGFGTDLCMVNLVLSDMQYFRAWSGELPADLAEARQDPRERSMCQYVVEDEKPLVVEDFLTTERFKDQYFCVNYGIRFYAGTPLFTSDGHAIGSLCLLNTEPIEFGEERMRLLGVFAKAVVGRLELLGALERERASNREISKIFESITDAFFAVDDEWQFTYINQEAERLLKRPKEHLLGKNLWEEFPEAVGSTFYRQYRRAMTERVKVEFEEFYPPLDMWVHVNAYPSEDGLSVYFQDITERKRIEEDLRKVQEHFRTVFEEAAIGLCTADPRSWTLLETNEAYQKMLGYTEEELRGKNISDFTHPDDARHDPEFAAKILSGEVKRYEREKRCVRKDGEIVWIYLSVSAVEGLAGEPRFIIAMLQDITERKTLEAQLEHQAFHDSLTGLPNRPLLMDRLDHALARARRDDSAVAVLFLDLDDFKVINDSLGHESGDRLLVQVAERLRRCLRQEDTAARLGGDEFAVLLEGVTDEGEAVRVADRIRDALGTPFSLGSHEAHEAHTSASIGMALGRPGRLNAQDFLRNADIAMYQAKASGKAHYELFEPAMNAKAGRRLEAENRLRKAIHRGEIVAYFQPKVSLEDGAILGMEALARWADPERGLVLPSEFIPMAEETGLIVPMGESLMREACRQAAEWRRERPGAAPVAVWVNLSPRQFHHADGVGQVSSVLRETGLEPCCLGLEITEDVMMDDAEATIETLKCLKSLGVRLAIDDFGKGYSSLNYVKRFPVDCLKVDRCFVRGICEHPEDLAIVQAVITLGRAFGMEVVAEGVETAEQLDLLRGLGCDYGQGYHFARPMPGGEASALLATHGDPR